MAVKIGIIGITGRMGQAIARIAREHSGFSFVGGLSRSAARFAGIEGVMTDKADLLFPLCDVIVDFSTPEVTAFYAREAARYGKAFLSGTTGMDEETMQVLRQVAEVVPVLYAANTSLSLAVFKKVVAETARLLRDKDFDIAIVEQHHRMKKDAPSGTAKLLCKTVIDANEGKHRPDFASVRAGFIVGEHEVLFAGQGEMISLRHSLTDRDVLARGAVEAALWLAGQKEPGFFGMDDILGA